LQKISLLEKFFRFPAQSAPSREKNRWRIGINIVGGYRHGGRRNSRVAGFI
jgi:hypothetical protein